MPNIRSAGHGWSSPNAVVAMAIAAALIVLAASAVLQAYAAASVDDVAVAREAQLMRYAISNHLEDVREDLVAQGIWSEAYEAANDPSRRQWFHPNYGLNLFEARKHSLTVVFDGEGRPVYAALGGEQTDPAKVADFVAAVRPVVDLARARSDALTVQNPAALGKARQTSAAAAVRVGGQAYLAAAATIVPELGYAKPPRRGAPIVASARAVDKPLLSALSAELRLRDARFVERAGPHAAAALLSAAGRPIGFISWQPERPSADMFGRKPWQVALFTGLVLIVVGALIFSLRRQARSLAQARDRAEAGDRAKSEFIANMSHEIRTPLNGVLGMAQVMEAHELSVPQRDRLRVMRESGAALLTLLNELLDFAKIEAGRLEIEAAPFDLDRLVRQVAATFEGMASAKGLALSVAVSPAAHGVWIGDALRVRQVLSNLVSNAVKFTERGGVTLAVTADDDGTLRFRVVDTGIGLEAAQIPGLFDKFIQADASTTRRYGGTGLGLSIVRALVELMGGEVSAESRPGEGACFNVVLPLARASEADAPVTLQTSAEPVAGRRGLRVLAAEDNATNRLVLAALLEPLGAELTLVSNGREAVEAFGADTFDVVLMDVQMPEMNGVDATRAIRAMEARGDRVRTPVLALTANVMSHQLESYRVAGMDGHIAKPVEVTGLYAALDAVLAPAEELAA
ncbi:hybrid sensor histidine kinase/response regulator [Phenylobacterium sp.]|uniref:hybrid sensor histidine kinase/response regulator n=1 Tax=Phenylobacterium sp. TaxID=1871053 RepID=UPI002EDAE2B6